MLVVVALTFLQYASTELVASMMVMNTLMGVLRCILDIETDVRGLILRNVDENEE